VPAGPHDASHLNPGAIMTLSARFSLLHSDLNDFLYASVGDEQNGMPPLAPMIARLSIGRSQQSDNVAIAQRLVGLLPMRGHAAAQPNREPADAGVKKYAHAIMLLVCLALAAAILSGML
jgi:hypothetical protein